MRWTGPLLIVLALSSLGCVRGDWTTETLTLIDVTGTWDGRLVFKGGSCGTVTGCERSLQLILRQRGASVSGEVTSSSLHVGGKKVEGVIKGELFTFRIGALHGEASLSGDDLNGQAEGGSVNHSCPCTIPLHRAGPADTMQR
jgi:hypothetical protein